MNHIHMSVQKELDVLAEKISSHGLTTPAIFFLEMTKYVSFLGSQLMVFFGLIITVFVQGHSYYKYAEILEERDNVEYLIQQLEKSAKLSQTPQSMEDK